MDWHRASPCCFLQAWGRCCSSNHPQTSCPPSSCTSCCPSSWSSETDRGSHESLACHSDLLQDPHCYSKDCLTIAAALGSCLAAWTASGSGPPDRDCQGGSAAVTYYSSYLRGFVKAMDSSSCCLGYRGPEGCWDCCCSCFGARTDFEETLSHFNYWNYYFQTGVSSGCCYSDHLRC